MKSIVILSIFFGFIAAQSTTQGSFGTPISLNAQTLTTINFGLANTPPSLNVIVDTNTTIQVNLFLQTSLNTMGSLPTGYSALTLFAAVGFSITLGNGASLISANLTTGGLDAAALQAINASGRVGCLEFTANSRSYQDISISSFSLAQGITIPIPEAGTYIFTAVKLNAATPNFYGRIKKLLANVKTAVAYATNFTSNFVVEVTANANADLNVTFYSSNPAPKPAPSNFVPLGVYWDISASGSASVNAVLNFTYTAQQLAAAGIATANNLRFAFYNTVTSTWEVISGFSVDANLQVVSQTTTHFSQWGVYSYSQPASTQTQTETAVTTTSEAPVFVVSLLVLLFSLVMLV